MNEIIRKNLEKMSGKNRDDMPAVLMGESLGGNAEDWNGLPCGAANFYFKKWNGEIIIFGNLQYLPAGITKNNPNGTFVLAIKLKEGVAKIIKIILPKDTADEAKKNLKSTADEYNRQHGF